ncbi:unnamed protein product [Merluccius merluccius]
MRRFSATFECFQGLPRLTFACACEVGALCQMDRAPFVPLAACQTPPDGALQPDTSIPSTQRLCCSPIVSRPVGTIMCERKVVPEAK